MFKAIHVGNISCEENRIVLNAICIHIDDQFLVLSNDTEQMDAHKSDEENFHLLAHYSC